MRFRTLAWFGVLLVGCSSRRALEERRQVIPAADLGDVVARVDGVPIFANQVAAVAKTRGTSYRQALDEMIETYGLAQLAQGRGQGLEWDDPDVRRAMAQRLLERDIEPSLRPDTLPEAAVRPVYEKTHGHFVHSRLVEVAVLAVFTGAAMRKEDREPRERTARDLAAFLERHPPKTLSDFEAVAKDPAWKARAVTLRQFLQSADSPLSAHFGAEVAKLHAPGDTTPLVLDEDGGFIARYVSERPSEDVGFAEARPVLVDKLYEKLRQQQFLEATAKLERAHRVEAHVERLSTNEQGP